LKVIDNLCILYWHSARGIAYINIFKKLGLIPSKTVIINNSKPFPDDFYDESIRYGYDVFYEVSFDAIEYLKSNSPDTIELDIQNINDASMVEILKNTNKEYCLYTGGGIVAEAILSAFKGKLLHIHPGKLPLYRGSTCFYYSYLQESLMYATAFVMQKTLDSGEILCEKTFNINYFLDKDQKYFIDYIADPFIRAQVLNEILSIMSSDQDLIFKSQSDENAKSYYIAHPLLRYLAKMNMNDKCDMSKKLGIFEVKGFK